MVELRKRKAPAEPAPPQLSKKKSSIGKDATKEEDKPSTESATVGSTINLESFGGEVETNDGEKTTLKDLVEQSKSGVVLFTYPKASTPGCTTQVCLFRDSYSPLTATGFLIYGLSRDSPKANTTFKTKQDLPYPLLCDPAASLITAIGLNKPPSGTTRGVFVVDKSGKVLAAEPGGPAATVEVVRKLVIGDDATGSDATKAVDDQQEGSKAEAKVESGEAPQKVADGGQADGEAGEQEAHPTNGDAKDQELAKTASEVADTAAKLDA